MSTGNRNTDLSMTGLTLVGTKATYSAPQTDGGSSRLAYRLTNGVPDLINPASTPTSVSTRGASDSERLGFLASTLLVKVECVA